MNRILKYVFGTVEAELVSADPAAALTYYSAQGLRLQDPELTAPLTLTTPGGGWSLWPRPGETAAGVSGGMD